MWVSLIVDLKSSNFNKAPKLLFIIYVTEGTGENSSGNVGGKSQVFVWFLGRTKYLVGELMNELLIH